MGYSSVHGAERSREALARPPQALARQLMMEEERAFQLRLQQMAGSDRNSLCRCSIHHPLDAHDCPCQLQPTIPQFRLRRAIIASCCHFVHVLRCALLCNRALLPLCSTARGVLIGVVHADEAGSLEEGDHESLADQDEGELDPVRPPSTRHAAHTWASYRT
jgi:hypothetical protein